MACASCLCGPARVAQWWRSRLPRTLVCSRCHRELRTEEHFSQSAVKRHLDQVLGLRDTRRDLACLVCTEARVRQDEKDAQDAGQRGQMLCSLCHRFQSKLDFSMNQQTAKAAKRKCKDCAVEVKMQKDEEYRQKLQRLHAVGPTSDASSAARL